ncbi:MAG: thiamine-phosphate kinase [SAR86 cluster bacterium]|nr:thiamine-phosphate kinase [SAR86 cluster bacterium]
MLKGKSLNEHQLIKEYFSNIGSEFLLEKNISIGIGDDAAAYKPPKGYEVILSTDTSIEGVHFIKELSPQEIAYRSVAVALSDLAACGAEPNWFMVSLTMQKNDSIWLRNFSLGLEEIAQQFKIPLIGGDTTKGPLVITVQVGGIVQNGKMIRRSGAKKSDLIFVSGNIGNSKLGLKELRKSIPSRKVATRYIRPEPRFDLLHLLLDTASSAVDISDGLVQDLQHICNASQVGAKINIDLIPFSLNISPNDKKRFISEGDDYEICFTIPLDKKDRLRDYILDKKITEIGSVTKELDFIVENNKHEIIKFTKGYSHF